MLLFVCIVFVMCMIVVCFSFARGCFAFVICLPCVCCVFLIRLFCVVIGLLCVDFVVAMSVLGVMCLLVVSLEGV